jgi:hypothetical protein
MRVIVMDKDMSEPLTVIELPIEWIKEAERGRRDWRLPVPENLNSWAYNLDSIPEIFSTLKVLTIRLEPIRTSFNGSVCTSFWVAVAQDDALALLLRAAFLPGQATEMHRREAMAFFNGVFSGAGLGGEL